MLRLWFLVILACAGALAPSRACARMAETRAEVFLLQLQDSRPESAAQVADSHLANPLHGYDLVSGCCLAAESGAVRAADDVYVLGRQVDTAVAKQWPGHKILDIPDWTLKKNDAWIQGIIDSRGRVYLGSPQTRATLWDAANNRPTVFARELEQLRAAGYKQVGDYMVPPVP